MHTTITSSRERATIASTTGTPQNMVDRKSLIPSFIAGTICSFLSVSCALKATETVELLLVFGAFQTQQCIWFTLKKVNTLHPCQTLPQYKKKCMSTFYRLQLFAGAFQMLDAAAVFEGQKCACTGSQQLKIKYSII